MTTKYDHLKPYCTDRQWEYLQIKDAGASNIKIANILGIDRRAVDRGIASVYDKATKAGVILQDAPNLKVLYIDIETAPMMAYLWRMYQELNTVGAIKNDWYIMSYAYKWLDTPVDDTYAKTLNMTAKYKAGSEDDSELVSDLHSLLDEADIVIGHNGDNFDLKKIKARMIKYGMSPPSPYKTIDTLKICRREFGFTSNKLDYVAQYLFNESKLDTGGMTLWLRCIAGEEEAWTTMREYNAQDVELLERVYLKIRPWDRSTANLALLSPTDGHTCIACASENVEETGKHVHTPVSTFLGYVCGDCGHQMRGRVNIRTKTEKLNVLHNAK